jgi:transposase
LDTLYDDGVTELYRLIAATAAKRLGLAPRFAHLDRTSLHGDGRYNSRQEPAAAVMRITRGDSRDHRPDLNQVMLELIVAHHAGMPLLMPPLRGHSSDAHEVGQMVKNPSAQWQTTYGITSLGAESALYNADNLQKLAETQLQWITRVPATVSAAQAALAQADPQTMAPLSAGYRSQGLTSTYGGVAQRWMVVSSEHRHAQAQHTVDKPLLKQGQREVAAFQQRSRRTFACEADAQQALATLTQGLHATFLHTVAVRATPRYGTRGRPRQGAQPAHTLSTIDGALASSLAARSPLVDQQSCFILATHELDEALLPPTELLAHYTGQAHAERGFRFRKDPQFLASSLSLKKPERIMALLMVMTVCLLVYAA